MTPATPPVHDQPSPKSRRPVFVAFGVLAAITIITAAAMQGWIGADGGEQQPSDGAGPTTEGQPDEPLPDIPPSAEDDPPHDDEEFPSGGDITLSELTTGLIVVSAAGDIEFLSADGTRRTLTGPFAEHSSDTGRLRLVSDPHGGIIWQPVDNSASITHVDADGHTRQLLSVGDDEQLTLVGFDHSTDAALAVRSTGRDPDTMSGDLLSVPLSGQPPQTLVTAMTGWESGLSYATRRGDDLMYALFHEAFEGVFVRSSATTEPTLIFEAGEITGEYIRGVTIVDHTANNGAVTGIALIERSAGYPQQPSARLLLVDLADQELTKQVEVPLQLGADGTWNVPRDVSAVGSVVLVNRYAEGRWLTPLVYHQPSGRWAGLTDVEGRAFLWQR